MEVLSRSLTCLDWRLATVVGSGTRYSFRSPRSSCTTVTGAEKAGALLLLAATLAVGLRPEWLLRQIVPALSSPWFHAALNGGAR